MARPPSGNVMARWRRSSLWASFSVVNGSPLSIGVTSTCPITCTGLVSAPSGSSLCRIVLTATASASMTDMTGMSRVHTRMLWSIGPVSSTSLSPYPARTAAVSTAAEMAAMTPTTISPTTANFMWRAPLAHDSRSIASCWSLTGHGDQRVECRGNRNKRDAQADVGVRNADVDREHVARHQCGWIGR